MSIDQTIAHPSALLQPEWVNIIRQAAPEAEQQGKLLPEQLQLIEQQQWFTILVPAVYGGLEMPLPNVVRLEESLAWADGSLAWVVTLCCGAGWFGGFLQPDVARQIFSTPHVCLAGSGAATGTATLTSEGYLINGLWKYASGAHHATHFTANCVIQQKGQPVLTADGQPLIKSFVIDKAQVALVPAWKYIGMMGTGSHAFEIKDALVTANHSFEINADTITIDSQLYIYPFLQLAEATLAANLSGMALRFTELCEPLFAARAANGKLSAAQQNVLTAELQAATHILQDARQRFYQAVDVSWQAPQQQGLLRRVSSTSRRLAQTARECVDQLYPFCGLIAAAPDTEINQVWRNLHTASQHALLTFSE
ncbi:acyl-CoA dehydrogenase family protein [Mucilaginibacter koreensis]